MRESKGAQASTVRRRLAALSLLFKYLVQHDHAEKNPKEINWSRSFSRI
jgi:site-specific recombinase XerD